MRRPTGRFCSCSAFRPMWIYSRVEQTQAERDAHDAAVAKSARDLSPFSAEFRTRGNDGSVKWIRSTMSPTRRADGTIVWNGVMRDVTREKLAEDQVDL